MKKQFFLSRIVILLAVALLPLVSLNAQTKKEVTGTVTSSVDSEPLIGVDVVIKGTYTGAMTDADGKFAFTVSEGDILVFSYIGFITKEVPVGEESALTIQMDQDFKGLEEIVVIGYGTQRKSHLTGAISKVTNEGLDAIPVARLDAALIGQVSGVNISTTDASAGGDPTIHVRGVGSITADAAPLIVLDGVPVGNDFLGSIDMNDVKSIEILKDAASAAIYGSRGSNGVIMITSKDGIEGKTTFSFNGYWGTKFTPEYEFMPTIAEWNEFVDEYDVNGLVADKQDYINALGTETDWGDVMFDGGMISSYSLAARGGNDKTQFSISASYLDDEGVLLTDSYKKINLNLNVKTKVNDRMEFGLRANPSYTNKRDFPIGIHDALRQSPWLPLYHDENTLQYYNGSYGDVGVGDYPMERHFDNYDFYGNGGDVDLSTTSNVSPYAKVLERDFQRNTYLLFSNAYLQLNIMDGLSFRTSLGTDLRYYLDEDWTGAKAHRNGSSEMNNDITTSMRIRIVNENMLTYDKSFGKHDLNAVAGISFESTSYYNTQQTGTGYKFEYIRTLNASSIYEESYTERYEETLNSILGRVNYAYDDKYLFSLSLRTDGSSKFGVDTRYGFFPAVSVGWRVTEEDFMQDLEFISTLKARFSYGVTGNNKIKDYLHMSLLSPVTAVFGGSAVTGFNPSNIANPMLGWEQSKELNSGIDIAVMDNRFRLSVDYYQRTSKDLLLDQPMLSITGFDEATINIGEVKNSGVELELSALLVDNFNFTWNASANYSHNKNKLVDYAGADGTISYVDDKRPSEYIAKEGYPISSFYGYVYDKDIPLNYLRNAFYPIGASAQDCYVKDLNGDGIIDGDDRAILGSPYPEHIWSLNNNFTFRGFDFSFMLQGSHGAKIRNMDPQYFENHFSSGQDYITNVSDPNFFPDADKVVEKIYTDLIVQDASYLALRSVNLGYSLPKNIVDRVGFSRARLYVAVSNLIFLMSDEYTSFNPEGINGDDGSPLRAGYQVGAAPIAKTITFGVNLDF